jgi:hypothetical protein
MVVDRPDPVKHSSYFLSQPEGEQSMSKNFLRGSSEWALMVALVFGAGLFAQAQAAEEEPQGPVVQIGQADEGATTPGIEQRGGGVEQSQAPQYWIGLVVGEISPDHVLRAFVEIPEKQGLLVASVAPDSPAAKAGLKPHDILLRANNTDLHELHDLTDLVSVEGAKKGQIGLEVLRKSGRETVYVTPGERPDEAQRPQSGHDAFGGGFGVLGPDGLPKELLERFQGGAPFEFRNFGPGVGGGGIGNVPDGVSVSISKDGDKPAHITVKRGDETWEVDGADPESLKQLPEDLRPFVEQMLHGASPMDLRMGRSGDQPMPDFGDGRLRDRLERMEKQMQQMLERLNERQDTPKTDEQTK